MKVAGANIVQIIAQKVSFFARKNFLAIKEDKIAEINQTIKPSKINKNIFITTFLKNQYQDCGYCCYNNSSDKTYNIIFHFIPLKLL